MATGIKAAPKTKAPKADNLKAARAGDVGVDSDLIFLAQR